MMSISHRRRWLVCLAALTAAIFASGVCSSMYPFGNDPDHPSVRSPTNMPWIK
ncbi:hypothetical protein BZL30_4435 [Mycobacterium kansasii]|uniref:Uncharacterized protein n=1 Tax=Mycobacterium kansasii TaxID=1768 RepID=A0A1V3X3J3_MYCKA|nr:hypothetical protein BZL30_4435 [Mycobacterium kansasii]